MLVKLRLITYARVRHNSACHSTRHLTHRHPMPLRRDNSDSRSLVFRARFRKPCRIKPTAVMPHICNSSFYRHPIGMNVERRHEHGNLERLSAYEFRLLHSLNHHHFSIGGTHHHTLSRSFVHTCRTPEKVEYKTIHQHRQSRQHCREDPRRQKKPHRDVQRQQHYCQQYEDIRTFAVNLILQNTKAAIICDTMCKFIKNTSFGQIYRFFLLILHPLFTQGRF